jgi:hypothetical protein
VRTPYELKRGGEAEGVPGDPYADVLNQCGVVERMDFPGPRGRMGAKTRDHGDSGRVWWVGPAPWAHGRGRPERRC